MTSVLNLIIKVKRENDTYTAKVGGNDHVNHQVFKNGNQDLLLIVITFINSD